MRWETLFTDLESQWASEVASELEKDIAEATRFEQAGVSLSDRLRAQIGEVVRLLLPAGQVVDLRLQAVGEGWLAGSEGIHGVVVPQDAVCAVEGLGRGAQREHSTVRRRLGLSAVLRSLMRDRAVVEVRGADGDIIARGLLVGVGRDYLEVARTVAGEVPRLRDALGVRLVPLSAMTHVRAEGDALPGG